MNHDSVSNNCVERGRGREREIRPGIRSSKQSSSTSMLQVSSVFDKFMLTQYTQAKESDAPAMY